MNRKAIIIMALIFVVTALSGCVTGPNTVVAPGGEKVTVSEGTGTGPDWCKAGTKMTASGPQGEGAYEIKGITTYEDKSVCEAEMKVSGAPGGESTWKYYFTENSEYAVIIIKDSTGKEQKMVLSNPNP